LASRNHKEPNRSGSFEKHLAIMQMQCMHLLQRELVRLVRGSYRSPCSGSSFIHTNRNREAITKTKADVMITTIIIKISPAEWYQEAVTVPSHLKEL